MKMLNVVPSSLTLVRMMADPPSSGGPQADPSPAADPPKTDETLIGDPPPADLNAPPADPDKPAEEKPEDKPAEPPAPLTLESIKLPEGYQLDPDLGNQFLEVMNDAALTPNERAQKLVDLQISTLEKLSERGKTDWEEMTEQLRSDFRADKEVGGEKFAATVQTANDIVNRFSKNADGTENGLKAALKLTGFGNHVECGRLFARLAPFLKEPTDLPGGGAVLQGDKPTKDNLYPDQGKQ